MPKTTNLGLELTTSDTDTFASWRNAQNGQGAGTTESPLSNAQIIDNFAGAIFGASGTTTLYSGSWSNNTYNISVVELGNNDAIFFSPITALDKSTLENANIVITISGTTVTFTCVNSPTNNIGLNYFIARGK